MDMRKEFPSQVENRKQWILDTVRENQLVVRMLLYLLEEPEEIRAAKAILADLYKMDRDALLQPGGILTDKQIEVLRED